MVTAIKKSKLDQKLPELVVPAAVGAGLPESSVGPVLGLLGINPALIATVPGVTPGVVAAVMPAYQQAQAYSYHYLWYTIIPFVALSVVACACLESVADKSELRAMVKERVSIRGPFGRGNGHLRQKLRPFTVRSACPFTLHNHLEHHPRPPQ